MSSVPRGVLQTPAYEILELVKGPFEVAVWLPSVVFWAVSLPLHKEVGLSTNVLGVKDVLNFVVVFILDFDWRRRFRAPLRKKVQRALLQEIDMED